MAQSGCALCFPPDTGSTVSIRLTTTVPPMSEFSRLECHEDATLSQEKTVFQHFKRSRVRAVVFGRGPSRYEYISIAWKN